MTLVTVYIQIENALVTVKIYKIPKYRRFKIKIGKNVSEYQFSADIKELEYYKGVILTPEIYPYVYAYICQYFPEDMVKEKKGPDEFLRYHW